MLKEFKEFALRGNVVDLAIGIIIGGGFGKIVTSFVSDIVMPPIGLVTGGIDFSKKVVVLKAAQEGAEAVTLNYGAFINTVIDFVIVAFCIFLVIRWINKMQSKKAAEPAAPAKPSKQEELLTEIRDLLKSRS